MEKVGKKEEFFPSKLKIFGYRKGGEKIDL